MSLTSQRLATVAD